MTVIGVLAIQGDFAEHRAMLEKLGMKVREVRLPHQLDEIDGLIIPGGESTTIIQLIDIYEMRDSLRRHIRHDQMPTWGTCAGMIVMAGKLEDRRPEPLHLMDTVVSRNAFGRQVNSFEADIAVNGVCGPAYRAVFIRAPVFKSVGPSVQVLATLDDGTPVAVRENHMLATAFHPELTSDLRIHELFVNMVEDRG